MKLHEIQKLLDAFVSEHLIEAQAAAEASIAAVEDSEIC
jgi:hypothetical protein